MQSFENIMKYPAIIPFLMAFSLSAFGQTSIYSEVIIIRTPVYDSCDRGRVLTWIDEGTEVESYDEGCDENDSSVMMQPVYYFVDGVRDDGWVAEHDIDYRLKYIVPDSLWEVYKNMRFQLDQVYVTHENSLFSGIRLYFRNNWEQAITGVSFIVIPLNRDNEVVREQGGVFSRKLEYSGRINPGAMASYSAEKLFNSPAVESYRLTYISVRYADGSSARYRFEDVASPVMMKETFSGPGESGGR